MGKVRDSLYSVPSNTVSLLPMIVPFQQNMLSSSGKADIPESPLIYNSILKKKQIIRQNPSNQITLTKITGKHWDSTETWGFLRKYALVLFNQHVLVSFNQDFQDLNKKQREKNESWCLTIKAINSDCSLFSEQLKTQENYRVRNIVNHQLSTETKEI